MPNGNGDMWPIDQASAELMGGGGRPPTLDEMGSGEIYLDVGGVKSYTMPSQPEGARDILDEYGYSDFMISRDLKGRQKKLKKIKDITGVSKVENEEEYLYGAAGKDEQFDMKRMGGVERWLKADPQDKMMVTQVAKGDITPEEFRMIKTQQEVTKEQSLMKVLNQARGDLMQDIPERGGFLTEDGQRVPTTTGGVEKFMRGDDQTGVEFEGGKSTVTQVVRGGRGGAGSSKVPPKPVSGLGKELNDKLKILKGHASVTPKFADPTYQQLENDVRKIRTAEELQKKAGGVLRMPDGQAKKEAGDFVATGDVLNDILKDYETYPILKEQYKDPAEAAQYFKQKLDVLPAQMYNRVITLVNKGHSFEDIFKTISGVTGQKKFSLPPQRTEE